jgi:hypothetical protein
LTLFSGRYIICPDASRAAEHDDDDDDGHDDPDPPGAVIVRPHRTKTPPGCETGRFRLLFVARASSP